MRMQKEEIWGVKVKTRVQQWPRLVFLLARTNMHLCHNWLGDTSLRGDRVELWQHPPCTHDSDIPRAVLEQGTTSSQTKLCFPRSAFPISSSFGNQRRINICCLPPPIPSPWGGTQAQVNVPIDRQHPRLWLPCATMRHCPFCHPWWMMAGLSHIRHDLSPLPGTLGSAPGTVAVLGWVAWGDRGALPWTLHPFRLQFAFICRSWGVSKFELLKERGSCRRCSQRWG